MKILVSQPKFEDSTCQLEAEMRKHLDVDIVIFPEGYLKSNIEAASTLAGKYKKILITGYKKPKDRALIIGCNGDVILDREKYADAVISQVDGIKIGFLLCDELLLLDLHGIVGREIDFFAHPIGVGMFSDEQFSEWIEKATRIAVEHRTVVIGTSHANGKLKGHDISIPISYCINRDGTSIYISKNETSSKIVEIRNNSVSVVSS